MNTAPGTERKKGADDKKNIVSEYVYSFPSTPELMYDLYYSFYYMKTVNRFMGTKGIVISSETKLAGGELVQYFFKLHGIEKIDPVQAESFSFIFDVMTLVFIDNEEGMPKIEIEQGDPALNERVSRLFTNNDFWLIIKDMFDYFELIEPYLIEESQRIPYPETLSGFNDIILDNLNSLIFAFDNYTDNELEPLLKKCKNKELESKSNGETIVYNNLFEYAYFKIKDIQELIAQKYNGAYLWKKNIIPESKRDHIPRMTQTEIQSISPNIFKNYKYPVDKVTSNFIKLKAGEQTALKAESDKHGEKGKQANIYVLVVFDELETTAAAILKSLTSFDKSVFIAVSNLKEQNYDTVTTAQIYKAMGNRGRPSSKQREKIIESIEKMSRCRITLDNTEEKDILSYNYATYSSETFYLLPTRITKSYKNGLVVQDAIKILEIPQLYIFAKNRGQIATINANLLENVISQTEPNLLLRDYLLTRILRMKNRIAKNKSDAKTKIVLDTVYKNCGINERYERTRAKEKIEKLMKLWKKESLIKAYIITSKDIEIKF